MQSPSDFYKINAMIAQQTRASANISTPVAQVMNSWIAQASSSDVSDAEFITHVRNTLSNLPPFSVPAPTSM